MHIGIICNHIQYHVYCKLNQNAKHKSVDQGAFGRKKANLIDGWQDVVAFEGSAPFGAVVELYIPVEELVSWDFDEEDRGEESASDDEGEG